MQIIYGKNIWIWRCKHKIAYHTENIKQQWGQVAPITILKKEGMILGLFKKKKQISKKRKQFVKVTPKKNGLQKQYQELKESFELLAKINYKITLKEFRYILILCAVIGFLLGILFKNIFLSIVFTGALPLMAVQLIVLKRKEIEYMIERQIISYAELIKNSLLTTPSVLHSIEDITPRMQAPTQKVFEEMIHEVEIYNYPTKEALIRMQSKLKSTSLKELVEQLSLCDRDSRYITSLQTTVAFLNDKKEFLQLWDYRVKDITQKLYTLVFLLNMLVGMSYLTFPDMVKAFLLSPASKIIIAIFILVQIIVIFSVLHKIRSVQF